MLQVCKHNPYRDHERTVPELAVDVAEVMLTHEVRSTGDTSPYTKETNVAEVGHYLTDKIQTALAARRLNQSMANAAAHAAATPPPESK